MKKGFDILIKRGKIIDGTGNPWFRGDLGITNGRVREIGFLRGRSAERVIEAGDKAVSPGFIDLHNHSDLTALANPACESNLRQGITTAVVGNCGLSMAPVQPKIVDLVKAYLSPFMVPGFDYRWDWRSLGGFLDKIRRKRIALNLVPLVGHGTIRVAAAGFRKGPMGGKEMKKMKRLLQESLEEGAFGMSSGLVYPPGSYASTEELIELGKILKKFRRIYTTHLRSEGSGLIESVREAIEIGERNQIPVQISHHKAKGPNNWGKVHETLAMIERARKRGVDVSCEAYPYTASSTTITSILPSWAMEGGVDAMLTRLAEREVRDRLKLYYREDSPGRDHDFKDAGFQGIVIAACPPHPDYEGKSLEEIFREKRGSDDPYELFFDLLLEIRGNSTVVKYLMDEDDVKTVICHPLSAVISDSWSTSPRQGGKPHPRTYGTFPRMLKKYVREEKSLSLEEAIRKMTSLPASRIGLRDRGVLREGVWADLVIFDPEEIADRAGFDDPHQYPAGISHVLVNGGIAVHDGRQNRAFFGRVLTA